MIKTFLLSTVALAALAGTAAAADLPSRRAPPVYLPPPIPVFSWAGFYVGGQVGYEFGKSTASSYRTAGGAGIAGTTVNPNGFIGGAHIGYNFAGIPGFAFGGSSLVFGVEGDVDGSNYKRSYALGALNDYNRQDIQGSVRGRLGVAVDRALFYATGGAAFGGIQNNYVNAAGSIDSLSHTRVGYTVGAGVEYAFTNNWSARIEYRYTDFGSYTDVLGNTSGGAISVRHRETDNRVQAGVSYRFTSFAPAPVVARY